MHIVDGVQYANAAEIRAAIQRLDDRAKGRTFTTAERDSWNRLNASLEEVETEARRDRLREIARRPETHEPGVAHYDPTATRSATTPAGAAHERALGVVDRFTRSGVLSAAAADRLDAHVRRADPLGLDSRYLAAVGAPEYERAFHAILRDPQHGHLRLSAAEVEAMRSVSRIETERAAMAGGSDPTGGFALPLTLDPSVILASDGALCPIRSVARVITISTREWQGVSSEGTTAAYEAEATETTDTAPTLAGPTITTAMGRALTVFSMELLDDWSGLTNELVRLISDARDVLDSEKFYDGNGTTEPGGVMTGLTNAEKVTTIGSLSYTLADVWALKAAVANRFKAATTWAMHPDSLDTTYQFVAIGDETEAMVMPSRDSALLGKPVVEWTDMEPIEDVTPGAGDVIAIAGDFRAAFTIVDRLGMQAELVPHIMGPARHLPTGQRAIFARWRTGSAIVNRNALRYLAAKA